MPNFTFIDLFAGIGGFHQALTQLGGKCVLACEIDPSARQIYSNNYLGDGRDEFPFHADITNIDVQSVPLHDVLCAGFPCQPFSKSGKQLGINEARGTLFYNILEIVQVKKPSLIVLENVRNLAGPRHRETFATIRRLLCQLDYCVPEKPLVISPHKLPKPYGAPQHRERVYIVAIRNSVRSNASTQLNDLTDAISEIKTPKWDARDYCSSDIDGLQVPVSVNRAIETWGQLVVSLGTSGVSVPSFPLWYDTWGDHQDHTDLPGWKQKIVLKNEIFYRDNQAIIEKWKERHDNLKLLTPTQRKLEWQCGQHWEIWNSLIQLRPSGIRLKQLTHFPAMVAINQRSIIGANYRRYISVVEGLMLQGFDTSFSFGDQSDNISFKQLGNAVNVGAVMFVVLASQKYWGARFPNKAVRLRSDLKSEFNHEVTLKSGNQPSLF